MPKISIVIPTLNEKHQLPLLLDDLRKQTFKDFELVIADAGSTDGTRELVEEFGALVVDGGIPGLGRNKGAMAATGEVLVFMDADIRIPLYFLEKSLREFEEKNYDLAIPLFNSNHRLWKYRLLFKNGNLYKKLMRRTWYPDGTGQCVFIRPSVFWEIGGYNDWQVAEDTMLFWKAKRLKYKVGVLTTRIVSSVRRYEKYGILLIFTFWGLIGFLMITGLYFQPIRRRLEKFYGGWGKWE